MRNPNAQPGELGVGEGWREKTESKSSNTQPRLLLHKKGYCSIPKEGGHLQYSMGGMRCALKLFSLANCQGTSDAFLILELNSCLILNRDHVCKESPRKHKARSGLRHSPHPHSRRLQTSPRVEHGPCCEWSPGPIQNSWQTAMFLGERKPP